MASTEKRKRDEAPGREPAATAYRAPALEKGLDILELLAGQSAGLILSQIAHRLNRSVQEVYRVVLSLERRGYVTRADNDTFQLSMKLFDLASNHLPVQRLLHSAHPLLNNLAMRLQQMVIISVIDGWSTRVVVVADNPAPIGIRIRLGTQRPLLKTASGRTLLAFQPASYREQFIAALAQESREDNDDPARHLAEIKEIGRRGCEIASNETLHGITDISYPILDASNVAHAALTMPYLAWTDNAVKITEAAQHLFECASSLSVLIGGNLPRPDLSGLKGASRKYSPIE